MDQQNDFLNVLTRVANQFNNGSLVMVVSEAKNRMDAQSGTDWLDLWLAANEPSANVVLFRHVWNFQIDKQRFSLSNNSLMSRVI